MGSFGVRGRMKLLFRIGWDGMGWDNYRVECLVTPDKKTGLEIYRLYFNI